MPFQSTYGRIYIGLDGKPVERNPEEYPYSHDEYVVYKDKRFRSTDRTAWSDRLMEQDRKKFQEAVARTWPEKPGSQMFHDRNPDDIQKFLSEYMGHEILLTAILCGANAGNGNPYWVFTYRDKNEKE